MTLARNLLLMLVLVSGSSSALWQPSAADLPAEDGDAWAGMTSFTLPSGRRVFTHGPDGPAPHDHEDGGLNDLTDQVPEPRLRSYPYACVTDAATEYHNHVLYARAPDAADRFAQFNVTLREWVLAANTMLHAESLEFDVATDYRMLCHADGTLHIDTVVLPTPVATSSIYTIMAETEAAGYANPRAKYWILYDKPNAGYCGQAEWAIDERPGPENANNAGPNYAVTWPNPGCKDHWATMMHENGHNLGAVQQLAPDSDGYGHCLDGADVMCYVSVPPVFPLVGVKHTLQCAHMHYDCGHDTYFNPKPAPGSYLATSWNLGARHNRFFAFADVPAPPAGVSVEDLGAGQVRVSWTPVASTPAATLYRVYHGNGNLSTMAPAVEVAATETSATFASSSTWFLVTAVAPAGESRPSERATVAP